MGRTPTDTTHRNVNYLHPLAAPGILGLYAYSGSILLIALYLPGWYGSPETTPPLVAPFVLIFGGIAQFAAAILAFRSRQWVTTAISGMWALEHAAWAILYLLIAGQLVAAPVEAPFPGLGIWYITLAWVQWVGATVASRVSVPMTLAMATGGAGATILGVDEFFGLRMLTTAGAAILVLSASAGWYTASALLLQSAFGRPILPLGMVGQPPQVGPGLGEPGVRRVGRRL